MGYEYRYINKQIFENSVGYTLLLEDENKVVTRIEKAFKIDEQSIDEEFLRTEAKIEIEKILTQIPEEVVEVPPEEAISDG